MIQHFDFLDDETHAVLRAAAIVKPTWTRLDVPDFRHSAICTEWDGFAIFFEKAAKLALFQQPIFEVQLTRMVDGEFLAPHQDAQYGGAGQSDPLTTFVYYMGDHASFTGGRLLIGGEVVEPVDNSLVVFDGLVEHSIERIEGPGAQRLTINGCIKI